MAKSSLTRTITTIVATSFMILSIAGGAVIAHALTKNNLSSQLPDQGERVAKSIEKVEKTNTYGLIDEYTITYTDGSTSIFIVTNGANGEQGIQGIQGFPGNDGHTPTIEINADGYWVIDGVATTTKASGRDGLDGRGIVSIEKTNSSGLVDTYTITYSDNTTSEFVVVNGANGEIGAQGLPGTDGRTPVITINEEGYWVIDGVATTTKAQGPAGAQGPQGPAGTTPEIGPNGNWWIGTTDTGVPAEGVSGTSVLTGNGAPDESKGNVGDTYIDLQSGNTYTKTDAGWGNPVSNSGIAIPHIGDNGNWWIGDTDTTISATGPQGPQGPQGPAGTTPEIGANGNWWIGNTDTGVPAQGVSGSSVSAGNGTPNENTPGNNGDTYIDTATGKVYTKTDNGWEEQGNSGIAVPHIGDDGYWWIGDTPTTVQAQGPQGPAGSSIHVQNGAPAQDFGSDGDSYIDLDTWNFYVKENGVWVPHGNIRGGNGQDGVSVVSITKTGSEGLIDTYTITYSNGTTSTFTVTNGADGSIGTQGQPGPDGHTPVITISADGYWEIDGVKTDVKAQGPQGPIGPQGPAGTSVTVGHGVPDNNNGNVGDTYIDLDSGNVYQKGNEGWGSPVDNSGIAVPYVGPDGTWYIGNTSTGVQAQGASILSGSGAPTDGDGSVGDSYIDASNGDIYVKTDAGWGTPVGNIKGDTITVVSVVKTGTEGLVDTYTITYSDGNTATFTVTNGAKGDTGDAGANGKSLLIGTTIPNDAEGTDGDSYLNVSTWIYYVKESGAWVSKGTIKGSDAVSITDVSYTSSNGHVDTYTITFSDSSTTTFEVTNANTIITNNGEPTTQGVDGDIYIDTETWNFYVKEAGVWVLHGNIRGAQGPQGDPGTDGTSVRTGAGVPDDNDGQIGDSYIDTTTWDFYVKTNTGWGTPVGNIHNEPSTYTVSFDSASGTAVADITDVQEGHKITEPIAPTRDGYYFQGWYTSEGNKWNFEKDVVTGDITLIAHWAQFIVTNGIVTACSIESGDVVIPAVIEGQTVIGIANDLFKNKTGITSVTLPETLILIGDSAFEGCTGLTSIVIPSSVRAIGDNAFKGCSNIVYAFLNEGIQEIGASAFEDCSSLTSFIIPDSVQTVGASAFKGCSSLTSMIIPFVGGARTGANQYFAYIFGDAVSEATFVPASLQTVVLTGGNGETKDKLPDDAFTNCTSLTNIVLPNVVNNNPQALIRRASSTYGISEIGANAFKGCTGLTKFSFPSTVTTIGESAFEGCTGFTSIVIPNQIKTIGDNAYKGCSNAQYVFIGEGVENIGKSAFENCTSLTAMVIPNTVKHVGQNALKGCSNLATLSLPMNCWAGVFEKGHGAPQDSYGAETDWYLDLDTGTLYIKMGGTWTDMLSQPMKLGHGAPANDAYSVGNYYYDLDTSEYYLKTGVDSWYYGGVLANISATFPSLFGETSASSVTSIENLIITDGTIITFDQFNGMPNLKTVTLGDSVTSIVDDAFHDCTSLETVKLSNNLTSIGEYAFKGCSSLTSIVIPSSVTSIGYEAFRDCTSLSTLVIMDGAPMTIGQNAFQDCTSLVSVSFPSRITSFGTSAFQDCTGLTTVVFQEGEGSTTIGYRAFSGCTNIETLVLSNCITSIDSQNFENCKITSLVIPDSVTSIEAFAFARCSQLAVVYLGNGLTEIGNYAFYSAPLTNVVVPSSVTRLGIGVFGACDSLVSITLPYSWADNSENKSIQYIFHHGEAPHYSWELPTSLKTIVITGDNDIGANAFTGCSGIETLTIEGNPGIAKGALSGLTGLKTLTINKFGFVSEGNPFYSYGNGHPDIVNPNCSVYLDLDTWIFYENDGGGWTMCTEPTFADFADFKNMVPCPVLLIEGTPDSSTDHDNYMAVIDYTTSKVYAWTSGAWQEMITLYTLASISPSSVGAGYDYLGHLFGSDDYATQNSYVPSSLATLTITGGDANYVIPANALSNLSNLQTVTFGEKVTEISSYALANCTGLRNINLPDNLQIIHERAFDNCSSVNTLVIPENITHVGVGALHGMTGLNQ